MKKNNMRLLLAGLFLCAAMPVLAQEKSRDEKKLDSASLELDKDSAKPEGPAIVTEKLKSEFQVGDARVQGLRDQKLGYGEISIVLSLAKELPGGITDANVQRLMAMRQGPPVMGWGNIAKELGLKLGPAASKVRKVSAETRKEAKKARMEQKKAEKGERKMEKHERMEKMEKMERMEKGNRPENPGKR